MGADMRCIHEVSFLIENYRNDIVSIKTTLFERLGGEKGIKLAINRFFDIIISNPKI